MGCLAEQALKTSKQVPAHSDWCIMLCVKFVRQRDTSFHASLKLPAQLCT